MQKGGEKDWYLREWMELRELSQQRIHQLTGWSVGKVNEVFHSQTPYRRDSLNVLAEILEIEPYELLMPPARAEWYRRIDALVPLHPEIVALLDGGEG
jgi:transcriptional regulator with XRE-family HTH domain